MEHVDKVYPGGAKAVADFSLDIDDGEFMVLVGPSGCGKSTALRMIAGLEDISAGTVKIGDRVVNDVPPKDRDIAMVFQNYALYPHMTVEENLGFALKLRHVSKGEMARRVHEAADMLALEPYLKRKPAALSGGQRQRVAMGRAIVREPQAFLMDEPLSNLDAKLRVSMRATLNALHKRLGTTTVYVTHDQIEAMTLGDRVAVMKDGRLQQADAPQTLFDEPRNLFVAGFIGSPAMNLVDAELVRDDGPAVVFGSVRLPVPAEAISRRRGLEDYFGKKLIIGIRPSNFEDAGVLRDSRLPTMTVTASITEELGSEVNVIFEIDAPAVTHADTQALAKDVGEEEESPVAVAASHQLWTARVDPHTRARPGSEVTLAVDTSAMHFFDPDTGLAVGLPDRERQPAMAGAGGTGNSRQASSAGASGADSMSAPQRPEAATPSDTGQDAADPEGPGVYRSLPERPIGS
jgi:multiple sugar transport system ATP-binding protein